MNISLLTASWVVTYVTREKALHIVVHEYGMLTT